MTPCCPGKSARGDPPAGPPAPPRPRDPWGGCTSGPAFNTGLANLLDEIVEGRIEALTPEEEREQEQYEAALATLTRLARRSASRRNEALEALRAVPLPEPQQLPEQGGGMKQPLLTTAESAWA